MPHAFIGVDVIVGTRGETDEFFEDARNFINSLDISQLHVFSYSERPGTQALKIAHSVDPKVKHARSQQLLDISDRKLMLSTTPISAVRRKFYSNIHAKTAGCTVSQRIILKSRYLTTVRW